MRIKMNQIEAGLCLSSKCLCSPSKALNQGNWFCHYIDHNAILRCSSKFTAVFCIYTKCGRIGRASRCFDHPSHSGDFRLWWFGAQDHECWTWNFELNGQNFKVLSWFTVTNLLNFEAGLKFMKSSMFLKKNLFPQ